MTITREFLQDRPLSYSSLKEFAKSPSHYIQYVFNPREQSKEMNLGSAIHTMILEMENFGKKFAVAPSVDRRTKEGKDKWEEFASTVGDKSILSVDDNATAHEIVTKLFRDKSAKDFLNKDGHVEKEWRKELFGLPFRGFMDKETDDYVIEIKTTSDGEPKTFIHDFMKRKYYMQAAIYHAVTGKDIRYLVIETKPPYNYFISEISQEYLDYGLEEVSKLCSRFDECLVLNAWSAGYEFMSDSPIIIDRPYWLK